MLKQRVITALILAPLVIWGILALSTPAISVFFGVMLLLGAWEWARFSMRESVPARVAYVGVVGLALFGVQQWPQAVEWLLPLAAAWWLFLFWPVYFKPKLDSPWSNWIKDVAGLLTLVPTWIALVWLHALNPIWVLVVLVIIWTADSGAYFAGRSFGKVKLAPAVSPGKTREGVYGAIVLSLLVGIGFGIWQDMDLLPWLGLVLVTVIVSVLGDLFESLMKRQAGVKDSGNLIPGHGGVMDRIDSVTAAAPVFAFGLWSMGWLA